MQKDIWDNIADGQKTILVGTSIFIGVCILLWQVYYWLKTGIWNEMPLSVSINYLGLDLTYLYSPQNWKGVAKIARMLLDLPTSFVLPIIIWGITSLIKVLIQEEYSSE